MASRSHQCVGLQMQKNVGNSVSMNLYRPFKLYIKHKHGLDGKQAYEVL